MAEENILLKVGIDEAQIKRSQDAIISARSEIEKLKATQKDLADNGQANSKAFIDNETQIRKYSASVRENQRVLDANAKISEDAGGSIADLRANVKRLQNEYINLSAAERDNTDAGKNLQKQIKAQNDELKNLEEEIGITSRSVGDYTNSIIEAFDSSGLFTKAQSALATAQKTVKGAFDGGSLSAKGFGKALIATGIGAIVVLLGSLITYLLNTQKGMDAVAQATEAVGTFIGVVFDAFGKLGAQVVNSVIPTFKGLGKILEGVFTLDFDKVTEGIDGVKKAVDGIEGVNVLELGANAGKAAAEAVKLTKEMQELNRAEKALELERKQARAQIAKDKFIAEDTTKSLKERAAAAERAIGKENELLQKSLALQEKVVKNIKAKNDLTESTDEDINRAIEAEGKLADLQQESTEKSIELNNKLNGLRKEAAAAQKEQTDKQAAEDKKAADDKKVSDEKAASEKLSLAKAELDLFLATEKSKLEGSKELTAELIKEEEKRLNEIQKRTLDQLEKEKGVNAAKIEEKKANNEALTQAEIEYETQRFLLAKETDQKIQTNKQNLDEQIKLQKLNQIEAQKEIDLANAQTQLEADLLFNQQAYDAEIKQLEQFLQDKKITEDQFREKKRQADETQAEMDRLARINDTQNQLNQYAKITAGLQGLFGKNKAIASATALINGGLAVTEILKAPAAPFIEPMASVVRGVQIAGVVGTTARSVAQINSAKFEDGGSIGVVGSSHAGGGVDLALGGRTVANVEGGEGIFVMKKNAYSALRNLSSFNEMHGGNSWFSGGKTHLADGGAVARSGAPTIDRRMFQDNSRALESSIGSMTIVTKITDLERVQQDVRTVEITSDLV
jgi:hypothetical protein